MVNMYVCMHACACVRISCVRRRDVPARACTRTRGFFTNRSVHLLLMFVCGLWGMLCVLLSVIDGFVCVGVGSIWGMLWGVLGAIVGYIV